MDVPRVDDICSTIGNVARIAAVVDLAEAVAACAAAEAGPLDLVLLDPHRKPASPGDNLENRQVLEAFLQFRWHLEAIRRQSAAVTAAPPAAVEDPGAGAAADIERLSCPPEDYA